MIRLVLAHNIKYNVLKKPLPIVIEEIAEFVHIKVTHKLFLLEKGIVFIKFMTNNPNRTLFPN